MRTILVSLSNPHPALCLAACKVLRGLSRSVNVLRTSLVDASGSADRGLSETMCQLIGDERVESSVRDEALGAVANLLLEFSPLREVQILSLLHRWAWTDPLYMFWIETIGTRCSRSTHQDDLFFHRRSYCLATSANDIEFSLGAAECRLW